MQRLPSTVDGVSNRKPDLTDLSITSKIAGERAPPSARRRVAHDHTAALTGRFASRQHRTLARPVEKRCGVRRADGEAVCPPDRLSGSLGREGTTDNPSQGHHDRRRTQEDHGRRLDTLAALLDEGHSDQLTALLKTMARFHKYSFLCDPQHSQENVHRSTMLIGRRDEKRGVSFCAPW